MNPWMHYSWLDKNPGPFKVGDRVAFRFGPVEMEGDIVEDRGPLGLGGKRLYGVIFRVDDVSDPMYMEYAAEELRRVTAPTPQNDPARSED
jgi:hypothetical protein